MPHPIIIISIVILMLNGCHVRAYPPLDAQGKPTALPVVVVDSAEPPGEPMAWWEMLLAVGGGLNKLENFTLDI